MLHNKNGRKYYYSINTDEFLALVPLRSSLKHDNGIRTINGGGIDFSKVIFISPDHFEYCVKDEALIANKEYNILYSKKGLFVSKLIKAIESYIEADSTPEAKRHQGQKNLLRYSTLANYSEHLEEILDKLEEL